MTKNAKDLRIIENNTAKHFMTKKCFKAELLGKMKIKSSKDVPEKKCP